jgi:hypothetical protein
MLFCALAGSQAAEIPGVGVKLAVSNAKPKLAEGDEEPEGVFPGIGYRGETVEGVLNIEPKLSYGEKQTDYLAKLKAGGPIGPVTFGGPEYDVFFPAIDVRVVNNSKAALHISRVDLKVADSRPDPTPLPMVFGGYSEVQHIVLFNEGWGKIDKAEFEFDLVSTEPKGKPAGELPFKRSLQRVTKSAILSLHDELEKKGVSPELVAAAREYCEVGQKLEAIGSTDSDEPDKDGGFTALEEKQGKLSEKLFAMAEKGCGPFWKGRDESEQPVINCWLHGWMTVSWQEGAEMRDMRLAVICPVLVIPPDGLGAPGPVSGHYEAMLSREGKDYTLQVPVSHVVKPGGIARFDVTLGVPETSRHEFSVSLMTTDGKSIDAGKVRLAGLLPRGAESALKTKVEAPAE